MEPLTPPRELSTPFSQEVLDAVVPNTFTGPKAIFTGREDPEAHLSAFHTQMVLVGGTDAAKCEIFMSTLTGDAMDWFISLPDAHITSFRQLSRLFREQYLANRPPPPEPYDLFGVKQYQGESLKEYINRFDAQVVKVGATDQNMIACAFRRGVCPGPFHESITQRRPRTFSEIRRRAVEHIASEEKVYMKRVSVVPSRPRAQARAPPVRVNETTTERRKTDRRRPYEARKPLPRGPAQVERPARERARPARYHFVVELKDLIAVPNIAERLRWPAKTDKVLGPRKESWCEFHEAFGHNLDNCLSLGYQLDELVRSGFLRDYITETAATTALPAASEGQAHEGHEMPVLGEVHTIAGGFSGRGPTASQRKKYARGVNSIEERISGEPWESDLVFRRADLLDVIPHDNDPVVISVVTAGRKVHRVLVDQGSSADVMFWSTFNKLRLSPDLLSPYTGCLYGFGDNQVEVRGYLELRTTLTDGEASRTESIRYLVVNAHSAYNILLGRPALNRLNAVSSTRHMKMKLPDLSGKVIVVKSDQEEARKCYENSLKSKRNVFMVYERPPSADTTMIEATLAGSTPNEAIPARATPEADTPMEEGPDDAAPMTEAAPVEDDSREQPTANAVEREIGGKPFKLGSSLSPEEQEGVAGVISRHLDAFAWSASDMPGIDPDFLCHYLSMDATVRPVHQRRRKFNEEQQQVVKDETQKLLKAGHIREIEYPEWLANVVLVKKVNGKWRMCVDFTDLNKACPKDSYPLPSIDALVDSASSSKVLSFLDAFSRYNQIKMHPRDVNKTAFMTETCSYCYKVMPFGLKNAGAMYQRLMDKVLAPMLGRNVYAYVDDIVVASQDRAQHMADLEELFITISKYRLKLNPEKCVFGVEAGKFLGFMLTEGDRSKPRQVRGDYRHAKPDVGEGGATADGADGGALKVCFRRGREGASILPVPQEKQPLCMD